VGARPSMGKTAFLLCAALNQLKLGIRVYYFTLEMSEADMIARLVSIKTGIPLFDILERRMDDDRSRRIVGALPDIALLHGEWSEETNLKKIESLLAKVEPGSRSIVYVDFLGLVRVPGMDATQQYAVTTEIGLGLQRAAMVLNIPIVAAVQLNRQIELRKEKHPILADLRDSGRLEEAAYTALGLYRPRFGLKDKDNELQVFCLKNKNGPVENYVLGWDGPCARVKAASKLSWTEVA